MDYIDEAFRLAKRFHEGQVDKAGAPYLEHVMRVADRMSSPRAYAAAMLHDILEDTEATEADLTAAGIPEAVIEAVNLLTKTDGEPNADYYRRIRNNPLAREVKLADIADNADPARLALLDEETRTRLEAKYEAARIAVL